MPIILPSSLLSLDVRVGDCRELLRAMPDESVQCCVTSPPYWGLRDYGHAGQIGQEDTPELFVQAMVEVFREVRRVMKADGTCWLNLGDSYYNKSLTGVPWRVALGMVADGWRLRSDIIWHKPNPMPESATDRPTKSHEYIFLLTKSESYYYDHEAIKEPAEYPDDKRRPVGSKGAWEIDGREQRANGGGKAYDHDTSMRNKRSVWKVTAR